MRRLCLACAGLALAALASARLLPPPLWLPALWLLPFFVTLAAVGAAGWALELVLGPVHRTAATLLGSALVGFGALHAVFARAPGTSGEGLPLSDLAGKALSISALAATLGGAALAGQGLRAPERRVRAAAAAALVGAAAVIGATARAVGVPFLSPLSLGLAAAAVGLVGLLREESAPP